jgi:predicted dehydrogenase
MTERRLAGVTRRGFLRSTVGGAAMAAAPYFVPASVLGASAPSNRIHLGIIGCGNQCRIDLPAFLGHDDAQVLAVCDVNTASYGYREETHFLGRTVQQENVNRFYAEKTGIGGYRGCDGYVDFREMLAREDIDAVVIIVPDHWHSVMTIAACKAGKDVYCEKPLSLTVAEGQEMVRAVRKHQRVLQTGSHYRSSPNARYACELALNGKLGQLRTIHTFIAEQNATDPGPDWRPMPVPEGFDYAMWLGPAPDAPYHIDRCLYRFRFLLDYSGGQTTNFGAHSNDLAQWGTGNCLSCPVEFEDNGSEWPPEEYFFNTATKVAFKARYANGVEVICETMAPWFGTRFVGSEGWAQVDYRGVHVSHESLKDVRFGPNDIRLPQANPDRTADSSRYHIPDHARNFLDCVKSRQDPIASVEVGHHTANFCHLGNIAMMLKRTIRWDPQNEQILGDAEASALLRRPLRAPWSLDV